MSDINNVYVIIPANEITEEMIESAIQTSVATLRKSLDETLAILKYNGSEPACFNNYTKYNHEEILEILSTSDWTDWTDENV